MTPLQIAHAYATIGAGGIRRPITFERVSGPVAGERVIDAGVAKSLIGLMEHVVAPGGTGVRAAVVGFRVSGKTGTAWKAYAGGYSTDHFLAVFAGVVPATHPKLATVIIIDDPGGTLHQAADVAAPVFSNVMSGALRLMDIPPDDLQNVPAQTLVQANDIP
jgi:cell division protein FtsI (penicillin-binding protein 3)